MTDSIPEKLGKYKIVRDYYGRSPSRNPQGPDSGEYKVLRGGSWSYIVERNVRTALRDYGLHPTDSNCFAGFRCAQE